MRIIRTVTTFDAPDLAVESAFWAGLLGGTVAPEDDWHSLLVDGQWRMGFQLAPNHVAPEWPTGDQQQQIHLDVWVDDLQAAHRKVLALGGRLLQESQNLDAIEQWQVYADPAGHPFCLCWADGDE